jgi:hypothetical protein
MSAAAADQAVLPSAEISGDKVATPVGIERRTEPRRPLNIGFHVVPLDGRGKPIYSAAFTARGKDISDSGLAVSHLKPMEYPRAWISTMGSSTDQFRLEADVVWTSPMSNGTYETGFKVTRKIIEAL